MRFLPARRGVVFVVVLFFCFLAIFPALNPLFAQAPQVGAAPTPGVAQWQFDPEVTEVGKNADRARQLLWWVFSHPGINTAPILVEMWSVSRNIVYVFVILVVIAFGFSFILLRRRASSVNIPPILVKIGGLLLYVTFSYLVVLAIIQVSEISMRFFIENVGGRDLFNVIFSGAGNSEANYINFVGYSDTNPTSREMVKTSLLLIQMTSFTYFVMSTLLLLRTIILWFMMILSPFLALLLPFMLVRNIGIIWIGVFLQWLFYGPLMALFLATVTKIWVAGIPFSFDFSRAGIASGQVYKTAINILYGGPAQTLSAGNSANYIDTYAEYLITLIMLWAAIVLPWFLVRIFRDYCCDAIKASNATLSGIFDRIRQYPVLPLTGPLAPTTTAGMAVELPFRHKIGEEIEELHKRLENIQEISRIHTTEIARAMDISVNSLSDVSRLEINQVKKSNVSTELGKLYSPEKISSNVERQKYAAIRGELQTRAAAGDRVAQTMIIAGSGNREALVAQVSVNIAGRPQVATVPRAGVSALPYMPVSMAGKQVATSVSVQDYEDVKKMWLKHYRDAPIPESETIKTRTQWLQEEEVKLTNILNLLSSHEAKLRREGLEGVSEILPFMLLGGFSDAEVLAYVKAKLEAAKQTQTELEVAEKIKKETTEAVLKEEEETLLEKPVKKEEKKEDELKMEAEVEKEVDKSAN